MGAAASETGKARERGGAPEQWRARGARARLLLEAAVELTWALRRLRNTPIDTLLAGERHPATERIPAAAARDPSAFAVGWALTAAARRLPWSCNCLTMTLAGQRMLARRGLGPVVHLGLRHGSDGLRAHAWLEAGGGVVSGADAMDQFTPLVRITLPQA
ncbi:lasso peptide biosynthesis B2 protein [Caulobacter sp. FWC2]|uniref:lasso peptide biosynthesis B2 protein n=1 Tax=Caulobacter sp. FWC2 TaxID=69664 RepID=UPI000C155886|nr:lasso peptide biosynthesis B2 protein [Caulobacter sp. FWC2]PIB92128.1 hypothetical protein CSW62_11445 [Caulobacter sp. FWC2]